MPDGTPRPRRGGETAPLAVRAPATRDARLDVFRGLALVMIFVNHVPGTVFEHYTSRNFGFSDAAEGFVLMSGMAAGLAYSSQFLNRPLWPAVARVLARARTLYLVHLSTTLMALAIVAVAALYFDLPQMLRTNNIGPFLERPLEVIIGLPLLTHQLGYLNILPLYAVLLVVTPLFILLALRRPLILLALSILVWALAGQFRINFPAYPNPGGWFFNPVSWQLLFVVGLLSGMAMKRGERLVPKRRWLVWSAGLFLFGILVWSKSPFVAEAGRSGLARLGEIGVPFYLAGFDKTFLALPRLLHVLALAYFLSSQDWVRRVAQSAPAFPLALLGRHALPVFATGSVLSVLMQAVKAGIGDHVATDALLLSTGLAVQLLLAYALHRGRKAQASLIARESGHPGDRCDHDRSGPPQPAGLISIASLAAASPHSRRASARSSLDAST